MPTYDFSCAAGHGFDRLVKLADRDAPQSCDCGAPAVRLISAPRLARSDAIEPCLGMDGKTYDSLAGYRRTLLPENNPKGERYLELGHEEIKHAPPQFDKKQRRDDIKKAIQDVKYGRVPPAPATGA